MTTQSLEVMTPYSLFFKALANAARMRIINVLRDGPKSVTDICRELEFEQTMVSHHLKCLSFCGFVNSDKHGKNRIYSLNEETVIPLLKIVDKHLCKYAANLFECEALKR